MGPQGCVTKGAEDFIQGTGKRSEVLSKGIT